MCAVSFVGDAYQRHFNELPLWKYNYQPIAGGGAGAEPAPSVSKQDFDELKKKVEEMIEMMKAARQFDIVTKQDGCEMDEKVKFLQGVADLVGLELNLKKGDGVGEI